MNRIKTVEDIAFFSSGKNEMSTSSSYVIPDSKIDLFKSTIFPCDNNWIRFSSIPSHSSVWVYNQFNKWLIHS